MNVPRQAPCRWLRIAIALIPMLGGCALTPPLDLSQDLPDSVLLSQVPFHPQRAYQCGPAALATVLEHQGIEVDLDSLEAALYIPAKQGSLAIELGAYPRLHQLISYPLNASLHNLLREVAAGHPVLVFQNLGFSWWPQHHFAVVIGYDLTQGELILRSGQEPERRTALKVFERTWHRVDHWARVILPPDQIPATAEPLVFLKAVAALEQTEHLEAAASGYRSAQRRWPEQADIQSLASLGLSNIAWSQGDHRRAEHELRKLIRFTPESASGWNNLAYVLMARGCGRQARDAVRCAAALTPQADTIQDSLAEITANSQNMPQASDEHCALPVCPRASSSSARTSPAL